MDVRVTAAAAGTIDVGGDLTANRMGFGAMHITGPGIWGEPPDRDRAKAALRRAVELEVNFIEAVAHHGVSLRQVVLAWLLARSPQILPIPGSSSPEHVEENVAAASLELSPDEIRAITKGA
jgi:pyridoxine 4-dehydrogenase